MTTNVSMIVAVGPKYVIGLRNKLIWHSKEDFNHFKNITKDHPCIFGSTTFYGLPKYPLKNRLNVVLDNTQQQEITADNRGWVTCNSFETALLFCENYDEIFICGGKSIYEYALKYDFINRIYLTRISSESLNKFVETDIKNQFTYLDINMNNWKTILLRESNELTDSGEMMSLKFELLEKNNNL